MREGNVKTERFATLDLLRLVAALSVVAYHYLFRGAAGAPFLDVSYSQAAPLALYGYLGVNLFFLISGFVIAWSAEGRRWEDFAIARFARLYPGFVVCMTITFALLVVAGDPRLPATGAQFAANLLIFAPAAGQPFMDGAYWSIVLELIFYGWVMLAVMAGSFDRHRLTLVALWLAACTLNEFAIGSDALRLVFVTEYGPLFAGGVLVHHIWSRGRSPEALTLLAASFALSCANLEIARGWMLEHYGVAPPLARLLLADLALHALLIAAVVGARLVRPSPLVLTLGGLTYPLYLLHQNAGYLAINALAPVIGKWPALLAATCLALAASWLVWRFVEGPARRSLAARLTRLSTAIRADIAARSASRAASPVA